MMTDIVPITMLSVLDCLLISSRHPVQQRVSYFVPVRIATWRASPPAWLSFTLS